MLYLIKHYDDYDKVQFEVPWAAPCDSTGYPILNGKKGHYLAEAGKGGDLSAEDPDRLSVWIGGQVNRFTKEKNRFYVRFSNGKFHPLKSEDVTDALNEYYKDKEPVFAERPKKGAKKARSGSNGRGKRKKKEAQNTDSAENNNNKNCLTILQPKFAPKEYEHVKKYADLAGMSPTAYVKEQALGCVKVIDLTPLIDHTLSLGEAVAAINRLVSAAHPDRCLYEADLEEIAQQVDQILKIEENIHKAIRKAMK